MAEDNNRPEGYIEPEPLDKPAVTIPKEPSTYVNEQALEEDDNNGNIKPEPLDKPSVTIPKEPSIDVPQQGQKQEQVQHPEGYIGPEQQQLSVEQKDIDTDVDTREQLPDYVQMYEMMNGYNHLSKEELERQRKRERREKLFAAIGDAISAMSNLYFTSKGAPNLYDPTNNMSTATKARWDEIKKDRDAHQKEYMAGYWKAVEADKIARQERRQQKLDKLKEAKQSFDMEIKQAQDDRNASLQQLRMLSVQKDIDKKAIEIQRMEIDLKYEADLKQAEINQKNRAGRSTGTKSKGESVVIELYDREGKRHTFKNMTAAAQKAIEWGATPRVAVVSKRTDQLGRVTTTESQQRRSNAEIVAAANNQNKPRSGGWDEYEIH